MKKNWVLFFCIVCFAGIVWIYFKPRRTYKQGNDQHAIIVGTNAEYRPFTFVENGRVVGFDIDVIREVFKRLGKEIVVKDMPFDVLIPEMQRGSISVIAAGMTPNVGRKKVLLFSDVYFTGDPLVIVSLKQKPVYTLQDLLGKRVIVNDGYTADFYMSGFKDIQLTRLPSPANALLALRAGRALAYVVARAAVMPCIQESSGAVYEVSPLENVKEEYAFAISPRSPELVKQINAVLFAMKKDGMLDYYKKKWGID